MVYKVKIGMPISKIDTPALLVDLGLLKQNINTMAKAFAKTKINIRPHIKTHKCPQIAMLQIEAGAIGITCAKVSEAEVFAKAGIKNILIANQITGNAKIDRLTDLARICDLMVAVDNIQNVKDLNAACEEKKVRLKVLVEVNIGMDRCGVEPGIATLKLAQKVDSQPYLEFVGFQAYEGHLVLVKDTNERKQKVEKDFIPLKETIDLVESKGLKVAIVSGGGTGTYDLAEMYTPLTEVQVGSYVFMDITYGPIKKEFSSTLTVLSTVVSRPTPGRLVTDAGLKTMSSEFGWPELLGANQAKMHYLSEEHAVLNLENPDIVSLKGGDLVQFTPSHVCTTVNLNNKFHMIENGLLVDVWEIAARGCTQ